MIYWINGSYGVGKTTIAECLVKELKKAYIPYYFTYIDIISINICCYIHL